MKMKMKMSFAALEFYLGFLRCQPPVGMMYKASRRFLFLFPSHIPNDFFLQLTWNLSLRVTSRL